MTNYLNALRSLYLAMLNLTILPTENPLLLSLQMQQSIQGYQTYEKVGSATEDQPNLLPGGIVALVE
jgi:hypothetical protein